MSDFPQRRADHPYRGRPYLDSPYPAPPRRSPPPRSGPVGPRPPWRPAPPPVPRAPYVPVPAPDLGRCRKLRTRARLQLVVSSALVAILAGLLIAGHAQLTAANAALGTVVMLTGLVRMGQMIGRSRRLTRALDRR